MHREDPRVRLTLLDNERLLNLYSKLTVGGSRDNDIVIDHPRADPHICQIYWQEGDGCYVKNKGSRGVLINNDRLSKGAIRRLANNDRLHVFKSNKIERVAWVGFVVRYVEPRRVVLPASSVSAPPVQPIPQPVVNEVSKNKRQNPETGFQPFPLMPKEANEDDSSYACPVCMVQLVVSDE